MNSINNSLNLIPIHIPPIFNPHKIEAHLDVDEEEMFLGESYSELIDRKKEGFRPYILALVQDEGDSHIHYFDAENLKTWTDKNWTNPTTRKTISKLFHFSISADEIGVYSEFCYLGELKKGKKLNIQKPLGIKREKNFKKIDGNYDLLNLNPLKSSSIDIDLVDGFVFKMPFTTKKLGFSKFRKDISSLFAIIEDHGSSTLTFFDGLGFYQSKQEILINPATSKKIVQVAYCAIHVDQNENVSLKYLGTSKDLENKNFFITLYFQATMGNFDAQYLLGKCYADGTAVEQNFCEAFKWFKLAALKDHTEAEFELGICYLEGKGVVKNDKLAIDFLIKAAKKKHTAAGYHLGLSYLEGKGVLKDLERALIFFALAAEENFQPAIDKFEQWMKASKKEDSDIYCVLGVQFHKGEYLKQNFDYAVKLWKIAVEHGHKEAAYLLGLYYLIGENAKPAEGVKWMLVASNLGHCQANTRLGFCYANGLGVEENKELSAKYWKMAADQGDMEAQYNFGICSARGLGVNENYPLAVDYWQIAASQGDAEAEYNLGLCYFENLGVSQDLEKAVELWEKASKQNNLKALYALGLFYIHLETKQKIKEGLHLLERASKLGHNDAQFDLGVYYFEGQIVKQDLEKAVDLFMLAASGGHDNAQYHLGCCYDKGVGLEKDPQKAFQMWKKAAKKGNVDAQYSLGYYFLKKNNHLEAAKFWKLSAHGGHPDSQYYYGLMFYEGKGVEKNEKETAKWWKLSAKQGNVDASSELGLCYLEGRGVKINFEKAIKLLQFAAEENQVDALCNLGLCYEEGTGVEQNIETAINLWRIGASSGHEGCQYHLGLCYNEGRGVNQNIKEAIRLLTLSAEQNFVDAQFELACLYHLNENFEEAKIWYESAFNQGHTQAKENLKSVNLNLEKTFDKVRALLNYQEFKK